VLQYYRMLRAVAVDEVPLDPAVGTDERVAG